MKFEISKPKFKFNFNKEYSITDSKYYIDHLIKSINSNKKSLKIFKE